MAGLLFAILVLTAGCASPTRPSEPLSTRRQSVGYELSDGTVVRWGDVRTGEGTDRDGLPEHDYSDRSTAR